MYRALLVSLALSMGCTKANAPLPVHASDASTNDAGMDADAATATVTATVRVLDASVKWGNLPRVELTIANAGASAIDVVRPGTDNGTIEVARVTIAPVSAPAKKTVSSWAGSGASGVVSIAPGGSVTFALAERPGTAEEFLPGKYELSVVYQLSDYQRNRMKEAHVSAPGATELTVSTATAAFEIVSDGSAALAARRASYEGKDLANVELSLSACSSKLTVGARCQLDIVAKNRGATPVWLGPFWALRTRSPKGETVDGNGPRPSSPIRLGPNERRTLGGWSVAPDAPGRYTFNVLYGSENGAAQVSSPDVVVDVSR